MATTLSSNTGLNPLHGYGYLFWIPDVDNTYFENSFFIMGTGGQNIFVSPRQSLLIATHSHLYPDDINEHANTLFLKMWNNVIPIFKLGDLNFDSEIDILDVIHLSDSIIASLDYNAESDINSDDILDYEDITVVINRAFSKPKNLETSINFYKNDKLFKTKNIKKDDHFKKMFNFFYNCCLNSDLRINENLEFLMQAKALNEIFLKNKTNT